MALTTYDNLRKLNSKRRIRVISLPYKEITSDTKATLNPNSWKRDTHFGGKRRTKYRIIPRWKSKLGEKDRRWKKD